MASTDLKSGASIASQGLVAPSGLDLSQADLLNRKPTTPREISLGSIGSLSFPSDTPKYYTSISINTMSIRNNLLNVSNFLTIDSTIKLPLPVQISETLAVDYAQEELGLATGAATQAAGGLIGKGDLEQAFNNITGVIKNIATSALSGLISGATFGTIDNAKKAGFALVGIAPNQFLTVMLKGPQYKKHTLTWKLSPRNAKESASIQSIIKLLKNSMSPTLDKSQAFFNFPKVMQFSFIPNNNMLFKFKPCVIENIQVNYSPSGAPAFYTGSNAPDAIDLTISLLELEFWLAGEH